VANQQLRTLRAHNLRRSLSRRVDGHCIDENSRKTRPTEEPPAPNRRETPSALEAGSGMDDTNGLSSTRYAPAETHQHCTPALTSRTTRVSQGSWPERVSSLNLAPLCNVWISGAGWLSNGEWSQRQTFGGEQLGDPTLPLLGIS